MNRFGPFLTQLERELDVPYPARRHLLDEIAADLDAAFDAGLEAGLDEPSAHAAALDALRLHADPPTRAALEEIHRSAVGRLLHRLAPRARAVAGWSGAALPLALTVVYLFLEVPVLELLRLGGFAVYPIIAVGCLGVIAATRRAFLWGVARDHRPDALALDDSTPLHLALATILLGVGRAGSVPDGDGGERRQGGPDLPDPRVGAGVDHGGGARPGAHDAAPRRRHGAVARGARALVPWRDGEPLEGRIRLRALALCLRR
jgi:hypothetical protein